MDRGGAGGLLGGGQAQPAEPVVGRAGSVVGSGRGRLADGRPGRACDFHGVARPASDGCRLL